MEDCISQKGEIKFSQPGTFKFVLLMSMMYVTSLLLTAVTVHKMLMLGSLPVSGGTFVYPFSYFFGDIITEVYGYRISRQIIWAAFACMFAFDMGAALLAATPAPNNWSFEGAYEIVFGSLPRIFLGDFIAMTFGAFANAYILAKSKIMLHGKHFWLRSLYSTLIGEGIFNIIAFSIMFIGVVSFKAYLQVMFFSYAFKSLWAIFAIWPSFLLMRILKRVEGIDVYDYHTNFNPFRFYAN